ncbi:MAG: flavin-containing monooxygenase [Nannocystaceae bacterium]|nr:NAD(P)/FAD-dependent oxidoreductase [bacterium]
MKAERTRRVVIIGSGFGGLCTAIRLQAQGISDFCILERRSFMGGTWCQNRYPGAAVDVHSPLYSLSSEPWDWSRMFAERDELEAYTHAVIDKHRLRDKTVLGANVEAVVWDETRRRWIIETEAKGTFVATVVINASGPLSTPVVPDVPGKDTFEGASFHTNAWDPDFDVSGKRVAVVGSGASAAQVIPAVADQVSALHVFQRTPHWVLPRPDREFSALQRRLLSMRPVQRALRWGIYWMLESRVVGFKYSPFALEHLAQRKALAHLQAQVSDEGLRRTLTPDYTIGCKRIILSDTLYPALGRPNVTLHDAADAIERVVPEGVVTKTGTRIELDAIVWATGFDATDGVISYPVVGRGGVTLAGFWEAFPRAYLGTAVPGFPNFFILTGPNTGIGHTSALFIIEAQLEYVLRCLEELERSGQGTIEVREEAEAEYTRMIHREMDKTVWKQGGCRSWYHGKHGHVVAMFPGFSFMYRAMAKRYRADDHVLGV